MTCEKLKDVRHFVRELIKTDDFEDRIFLDSINSAKEELKDKEDKNLYAYKKAAENIGDKTYINIKGDSAMILQNKDEFSLFLKWDNLSKEDYFKLSYGKLELGFQIYPKKDFGLSRDFIGFSLTIDGVLACSAFPVDLNFASDEFYLSEDLNYTFEILLVEGEDGIVRAIRKVKIPKEFCKIIRECYLKIKSDDYKDLEGVEDRLNIQLQVKKLGGEVAERRYGVYKIKNEIQMSKLDSYIKLI